MQSMDTQQAMKTLWNVALLTLKKWVSKDWFRITMILLLGYGFLFNKFNFVVHINANNEIEEIPIHQKDKTLAFKDVTAKVVSYFKEDKRKPKGKNFGTSDDGNTGNTYSNLSFWGGMSESEVKKSEKKAKQLNYVSRFATIAQTEMKKFGIPASVILAQGLIESNAGESKLSTRNNNHFGMKCFSRKCKKGHCSNFTDDSHKDFFRIYSSPWQSYRAHSLMLQGASRYQSLFKLSNKDYTNWAYGLKNAGYATDKYYAETLIRTIEELDLHQYDE